jgi:hypothetical protein
MWDMWWTKWHWDRLFSEFFCFSLPVFSTMDIHTHNISSGVKNMPFFGSSSKTLIHHIYLNSSTTVPNSRRARNRTSSHSVAVIPWAKWRWGRFRSMYFNFPSPTIIPQMLHAVYRRP